MSNVSIEAYDKDKTSLKLCPIRNTKTHEVIKHTKDQRRIWKLVFKTFLMRRYSFKAKTSLKNWLIKTNFKNKITHFNYELVLWIFYIKRNLIIILIKWNTNKSKPKCLISVFSNEYFKNVNNVISLRKWRKSKQHF